jgi:hypothetical protein
VRNRLAALCVAALSLPVSAGAAPPFTATFTASTHTPKVNAKWFYAVHVGRGGKPARATITAQIVDPFGGVHPVPFGCCSARNVTNRSFTGVFRDYALYPPESKGFKLTFRVTVRVGAAKRVLTYWVRAG